MRTLLVLILGVAAGCTSSDAVWSSSVTQLTMHSSGGLLPPTQPSAECPTPGSEYTLVVAGHHLDAWRCPFGPSQQTPPMKTTVSRALTTAEYDGLVAKLEALRVVQMGPCGADKPETTVTVTTRAGMTEYGDSFYACDNADGLPLIDTNSLDGALNAFSQLAFPQP